MHNTLTKGVDRENGNVRRQEEQILEDAREKVPGFVMNDRGQDIEPVSRSDGNDNVLFDWCQFCFLENKREQLTLNPASLRRAPKSFHPAAVCGTERYIVQAVQYNAITNKAAKTVMTKVYHHLDLFKSKEGQLLDEGRNEKRMLTRRVCFQGHKQLLRQV